MTVRIESRGGKMVIDIRTRGPDGVLIRERRNAPDGVRSPSGAKRWAEARQAALANDGKPEEVEPAPTLREFGERWMREYAEANGHKPSTIAARETILRLHLYPVLGAVRVSHVDEPGVQRVKLEMSRLQAKTQACVLSTLSTILRTAERWGVIDKAPRVEVPRWQQPEMTFYDFEEWERLVDGARRAGPMVLAAVLLGGEAGLRRGELVALEQRDVGGHGINVSRNDWEGWVGTTKGNKARRVPLTPRLKEAIDAIRHLRGKRLLWQADGTPVGVPTLQSWLETACRRGGLPESRNLHKLRHTFCSHLAMRGATPKAIQELAGHSDLKTTQRYMHLSPAHLEEAISLLARGAGGEQDSQKASR